MNDATLLRDYLGLQIVRLAKTVVQEPKHKSEMIIQHYLKISKSDLYLKNILIDKKDIKALNIKFDKLMQNMPVQHIIGQTFFYDNRFLTPPGVFIPRPETELLVDCAIDFLYSSKKKLKILDLCTGSGCIVLSLAKKFPKHDFIGVDQSGLAIKTAKKNKKLLNINNVNFLKKDMFKLSMDKVDLLLCNPPYLAKKEIENLDNSVKNHDPEKALTDYKDGTSFYKFLILNFKSLIKKNGAMYIELPYSSVTKKIELFNSKSNTNNSLFFKDLEGKNRVIKIY